MDYVFNKKVENIMEQLSKILKSELSVAFNAGFKEASDIILNGRFNTPMEMGWEPDKDEPSELQCCKAHGRRHCFDCGYA